MQRALHGICFSIGPLVNIFASYSLVHPPLLSAGVGGFFICAAPQRPSCSDVPKCCKIICRELTQTPCRK